ncbi:MAG: hypothetical protein ACI89L_002442 [Phycisphaerales bacterium]|jgi:hypothetical protein
MTDPQHMSLEEIQSLLEEHGLSLNTPLFRQTLPEFLTKVEGSGVIRISANPEPTESVIDIYGDGFNMAASHVGPGLSFIETKSAEWDEPNRVCVELSIMDVINQSGRIYPVTSISTEPTWYATLPSGFVDIRTAEVED